MQSRGNFALFKLLVVVMMTMNMLIKVFFYGKDPLLWLGQVTAEVPMALCSTLDIMC